MSDPRRSAHARLRPDCESCGALGLGARAAGEETIVAAQISQSGRPVVLCTAAVREAWEEPPAVAVWVRERL